MNRVIKYLAILFFGFLWFLGCSRSSVVYLVDNGIVKDDFRYGDLYRLSNLSAYKMPIEKCNAPFTGKKVAMSLYLAGDSFTEEGRVKPSEYATDSYQRVFVAEPNYNLVLDKGKKILIIETVERHFRERFTNAPWNDWRTPESKVELKKPPFFEGVYQRILALEVPYYEEMHEAVVFSSRWALKIKELKADFAYKVFNRTDPAVNVVKNELVYDLDVEPGISSVYDVVTNDEINRLVKNANATYERYITMGFDEVYLSVIPNKTSLLIKNDTDYNNLIERFESNPNLKMPLISVWNEFSKKNYYEKGDSHWNCEGQKIWVDKVNERLLTFENNLSVQ